MYSQSICSKYVKQGEGGRLVVRALRAVDAVTHVHDLLMFKNSPLQKNSDLLR